MSDLLLIFFKYDKIKNTFCQENNYDLLRLTKSDFSKMEDIILKFLQI